MSDEDIEGQEIEVREIKQVDFYGDKISAAQGVDGEVYVPINPLTAFLGLNRRGQMQRIGRDPVLAKHTRTIRIDTGGGPQRQVCLPLDLLPGWLFGVTTGKMAPELQEKLNRYRAEAFKVLWNAFKGNIMPATPLPTDLTPAEQILAQAQAIAALAQQQVDFERGLAEAQQRHQTMADYMRGFVKDTKQGLREHEHRISALELQVKPEPAAEPTVSEAQAAEIAMAVRNVGILLTGIKGNSRYWQVYNELYHRYEIGAYRALKLKDYEAARQWLKNWHEELLDRLGEEGTNKISG